jgi:ketosteroid isomerase-like protein
MKRIIALTALLILGATSLTSAKVKYMSGNDAELLKQLESKLANAIVRRDIKLVGSIYSDGSIQTNTYSGELSKEQYLMRLKSNTDKIESISISNVMVRFYVDTAIVTGQMMVQGRNAEGNYNQQYRHLDRFTHTFVRQQGRWRLVAAHESVIAEFGIHTDY